MILIRDLDDRQVLLKTTGTNPWLKISCSLVEAGNNFAWKVYKKFRIYFLNWVSQIFMSSYDMCACISVSEPRHLKMHVSRVVCLCLCAVCTCVWVCLHVNLFACLCLPVKHTVLHVLAKVNDLVFLRKWKQDKCNCMIKRQSIGLSDQRNK